MYIGTASHQKEEWKLKNIWVGVFSISIGKERENPLASRSLITVDVFSKSIDFSRKRLQHR